MKYKLTNMKYKSWIEKQRRKKADLKDWSKSEKCQMLLESIKEKKEKKININDIPF